MDPSHLIVFMDYGFHLPLLDFGSCSASLAWEPSGSVGSPDAAIAAGADGEDSPGCRSAASSWQRRRRSRAHTRLCRWATSCPTWNELPIKECLVESVIYRSWTTTISPKSSQLQKPYFRREIVPVIDQISNHVTRKRARPGKPNRYYEVL